MWPWEHLAVGYVAYSLYVRGRDGESPTTREALAVAVGSQLPDLADKPLAWTVDLVATGYAVGHSIFVAPFVCLAAYALARKTEERRLTAAFSIPYLSHLGSDVVYPLALGREIEPRAVLWPAASPPPDARVVGRGFLEHVLLYLGRYLEQLAAGEPTPYLLFQAGLGLAVIALWLVDGAPVGADVARWVARLATRREPR